jgi:hypothetical protein
MEVAVMSLSARDQQALDGIADGLTASAPKLAAMLTTFTRLTSGEEMPANEAVTVGRPNTCGVRGLRRLEFQRAMPVLWMLIAIAALAIALAVSRSSSGDGCSTSWSVACGGSPASARSSRPASQTAADQVLRQTAIGQIAVGQAPPAPRPVPPAPRPAA